MAWVFTLLMVIFFMMIASSTENKLNGLLMVVNGLVFLISAAVCWISFRVERAELSTREQILRLEMRLAELTEEMKR